MFQELLHFFSFIICTGGLSLTVVGIILAVDTLLNPLIRHNFQAARPFLLMILGGLLTAFIGGRGLISIPTPKRLEIQAPADSVIRAEVIRNGQVIHQEEI
jgi:hypothetical protein